jgi:hypothetical protein
MPGFTDVMTPSELAIQVLPSKEPSTIALDA